MDNDMDRETLQLILDLHLQDGQDTVQRHHQQTGQASDFEMAAQMFENELRDLASFHSDKAMSRSIAYATVTDGDAIAEHVDEDHQASKDMACGTRTEDPAPNSASSNASVDGAMI
ncbi:hypothetical protein E4U42_006828 [Claviceps africana]|uniref:Uncharacterized protein n=1 Tax=Claviceps africana TaxID=83212 RepID=A0A8K0J7R4_9HYPO|nr:hypothetical protein E4U42_006828 [Claviceps africana]